jgi:hypothetical protein
VQVIIGIGASEGLLGVLAILFPERASALDVRLSIVFRLDKRSIDESRSRCDRMRMVGSVMVFLGLMIVAAGLASGP